MKKVLSLLFIMFLCISIVKAQENTLTPGAKSAILLEESTGKILYEFNSHEKRNPASMTKIMSMLLIMEALEDKVITMDQVVTVSKNASSMGGSQILLEEGEQMKVEDLLKGVAIASGNDAVVALAETVAGSEENFVKMMNDKLKELGLNDTNFKNCHGLDEEGHYSSAYDMAHIALELVKHEKILEFSSIYDTYLRENTDRKIWLVNTNKLVKFKSGVDGLKTGYTKEAGYCLTATMKKDNMRVIATVMGEENPTTRNSEISSLLDYAYAQVGIKKVVPKNKVIKKITMEKAKNEIEIVPINDVNYLYKKTDKKQNPTYKIKLNDIKLPIKKGNVIGKLELYLNGNKINTIDLTVKNDVEKSNLLELYLKNLKSMIIGDIKF